MRDTWSLPRDPDYFLTHLTDLQRQIRERLRAVGAEQSVDVLSGVEPPREGDTIFTIDVHAEEVIETFFASWGEEMPLLAISEGFPGDGGRTYPAGLAREEVTFTCIVDPIDGTRGLMYQKRSAWALAGIAPPPVGSLPTLDDIVLAVQTELPTTRSHLSDVLWAVRGAGMHAETHNLDNGHAQPFRPRPSRANTLLNGFGGLVKFFPGIKVAAAEIEERLLRELYGPDVGDSPPVFDDEYISSGGQLYELIAGHDRFTADLRPLLFASRQAQGNTHRLCAHPYDLCTELIAREAGVIVTDGHGGRLHDSLDIRGDCTWIGYANESLQAHIEPTLRRVLNGLSAQ